MKCHPLDIRSLHSLQASPLIIVAIKEKNSSVVYEGGGGGRRGYEASCGTVLKLYADLSPPIHLPIHP